LLGEPALVSPEGSEHLLEPRAAALLALAALEPGATRRRVAALLWPDSESANARQALRQQLLRLRKLGGGELLGGRDALKLAAHVKSDVGDDTAGGTLLGSFDYGEGDELARWVANARERLHRGMADRLGGLLAKAEAAGDLAGALPIALQLMAADPNSERSHRNLMRLHYLRGDVGRAQAAYEALRAMLEREFAALPSAETGQLARTIRAAGAAQPAGAMAVAPPSVLRPPRLVGREREWRALEACWTAPAAAIVTGIGGLGKTRLVTDFAATRGEVAAVAARPGDAFAPYSLLSRLARVLMRRVSAQIPQALGSEVARLLPELGKAEPVRDDADRARLLRAIDALLELAASGGLDGVLIDDLHYADAATLEALHGRIPAGSGLRWILTCRDDEMGPEGLALRDSLLSSGTGNKVELAALTEAQVSELLDSLDLPGFAGASLAAAIARHTGGNPLFILETVKTMLLENTGAGARFPAAANVTALIARRLGRLSAEAVRIARCAAVAGQDFSAELAAHVLGVRPLDLADAWTELESAHVLRDGAFAHDLIHEAAMASVPAAIARRLHAEIAAFLEAAGTEPARVAGHWTAARRPKEAGAAFTRAAARAGDAGRRVEEASLFERAAECFERCGDGGARFEALLARAEAMIFNDLGEATLAAMHAAEKVARNDDEMMRALLRKAEYLGECSDSEAAVKAGRAGIALARKAQRADLALLFSVVVAGGLCDLRRVDEALALLAPFRERDTTAVAPRSRIGYLIQLGITLDLANRLADALGAFDEAREIAASHGLKDLLANALSNLATTTSKRGELGRAIEFGRQGLQLWRESELLKGTPLQTQALLAHRLRDIGHYDEAISMLEEALQEFRRAGTRHWIFATAHRLALAYAHVGQHARALKLLAEDPADQPVKAQAVWIAHRAEVARLAGGSALRPIRVALSMLGGDLDDGNNRLVSLFASAIVPPAEGESMATAIAAWAAARERFGMAIAAHVRAAGCAMARGAPDRARPQIEAALRLFADHEPDNFYRAELWWVASGAFRATGQDAQADRMLVEGAEWIRRIAAEHVTVEYRDTFLERNPVNRALLAAAGGLG
jgi:DNA-binding SARP family transcriptional activator